MNKPITAFLDEQAADLFLRLRDDDISPQEIEAALDWQDLSHAHRAASSRIETLWQLADKVPRPPLPQEVGDKNLRFSSLSTSHTSFTWGWRLTAFVATVIVAIAAVIAYTQYPLRAVESVRYATVVGENRKVVLEDGSEIILGGASTVAVDYSRTRRHVSLSDGEAVFKVSKDRSRPFVVDSAGGQTWAVGTQFDVRRGLEGVTVSVIEGVVQVQSLAAGGTLHSVPAARLGAGHQVNYSAGGEIGVISRVPVDRIVSWQNGKLIFVNRTLADVVVDLNRYSRRLITLDDETLRSLRFTGVIMTGNIEEWLQALEKTLPVKLVRTDDQLMLASKMERRTHK